MIVSLDRLAVAGLQRMVIDLGRCLAQRGWKTRILFPDSSGEALLADWTAEAEPAEIVITDAIKHSSLPRSRQDVLRFEREIVRFNPSVVNLHSGVNYCSVKDVASVVLARKRPVVTIHAPHAERGAAQTRAVRLAAPFVKAFVANSAATAEGIAATGIRRSKIHTVNCGVRPTLAFGRPRARNLLGIPESAFVISAVGGLVAYKGFVELAEVVAHLNATGSETFLLIAGDGPEAEAVARAAQKLGNHCRMLGRVKDTTPVFAAADLFVLPSREEGFGLVYLEAAFQGVPSIGYRSGGAPDAIGDESTGLLVQPGDTVGLTEAIRALRADPQRRTRMGANAKARASASFTDEVMATGYEQILDRT